MLDNTYQAINYTDKDGNPSGGIVMGVGLNIQWQQGPLGRGEDRQEPNGAFVETVLDVVRMRLEFYQGANNGKFACEENALAISAIEKALEALNLRTQRREFEGTEGAHTP